MRGAQGWCLVALTACSLLLIAGIDPQIQHPAQLRTTAFFLTGLVVMTFGVLLIVAMIKGENKAQLSKCKGRLLIFGYVAVVLASGIVAFI